MGLQKGVSCIFRYNKKWESVLNVEIWDLYNLLNDDFTVTELDYMEFQSDRKNRLEGYGKNVLPSDIPNLSIPLSEVHAIRYRSPHNPLKKSIFF